MHYIVMGCGRVGAAVAARLDSAGHSVAVIDQNSDAFRRLGAEFNGQKVKGVGFDRDVLVKAGITEADGFAAVASGDNSNILAARTVREVFGLKNVVARIYDLRRAEVYERLGIPTVASIRWAVDQVLGEVLPRASRPEFSDSTGIMSLVHCAFNDGWLGLPLQRIERATGARVAFLSRLGKPILPEAATVLQAGDELHMLMTSEMITQVTGIISAEPHEGDA